MPNSRPRIVIATPADAAANNGNWRTAHRWRGLFGRGFQTIVQNASDTLGADADGAGMLIALHARKSANVIREFRRTHPTAPILLVLTGTDLYRDLADSRDAQESVATAHAIVLLQEDACRHLPAFAQSKSHVIYQSAKTLAPAAKPSGVLRCVVVGHLRSEKSPETIFSLIEDEICAPNIHILHIGSGLDDTLARKATQLSKRNANYRWCGTLPHGLTRAAIKRAHLLIHPSIMEGGANVIAEALTSGTPVLASRVSGNVGMLGTEYPGYFPVDDAAALGALLNRSLNDRRFFASLENASSARAPLFSVEAERSALRALVNGMLA